MFAEYITMCLYISVKQIRIKLWAENHRKTVEQNFIPISECTAYCSWLHPYLPNFQRQPLYQVGLIL